MAKKIEELVVEIKADIDDLKRDLDKATKQTKQFGDKAGNSVNGVSKSFSKAADAAKRFAGPAAAGLAIVALTNMTRNALSFADEIGKVSDKLGVSTSFLQEYRFAAELAGVSTATADTAFQRFSKRLGQFASGNAEAIKAFEEIGLNVRNSDGSIQNAEVAFESFLDSLANTTDESQRLANAVRIVDSEGAALVNMATNGADGFREAAEEARRLGIILDEETIRRAAEVNDQFTKVSAVLDVQFKKVLLELMPVLSDLAETLLDATQGVIKFGKSWGFIDKSAMDEAVMAVEETEERIQELGMKLSEGVGKQTARGFRGNRPESIIAMEEELAQLKSLLVEQRATLDQLRNPDLGDEGTEKKDTEGVVSLTDEQIARYKDIVQKLYDDVAQIQANAIDEEKAQMEAMFELEVNQRRRALEEEIALVAGNDEAIKALKTAFFEWEKAARMQLADEIAQYEADAAAKALKEREEAEKAELENQFLRMANNQERVADLYRQWSDVNAGLQNEMVESANAFSDAFTDMAMGAKVEWDSLVNDIIAGLLKIYIQQQLVGLLSPIFKGVSTFLPGAAPTPLPGQAGGGRISGPVIVGERGPEIFNPGGSGSIINNHTAQHMGSQMMTTPMAIEIRNEGANKRIDNVSATMTPEGLVTSVFLKDIDGGGPISTAIRQNVTNGVRR